MYRFVFRYILVDEFQDTNPLQFQILLLLVFGLDMVKPEEKTSTTPVFILADENQAIYRFQGATPENIQIAKNVFNCLEITLETNYRCSKEEIVAFTKKLRGIDIEPPDNKVIYTVSQTPIEEAQLIYSRINDFQGNLHDICVISQTEFQLGSIRNLLDTRKIPYVFVPDFRPKSIEKKYEIIFLAISQLPHEKNYNGKLSTRIRQIYETSEINESKDDVLKALLTLAVNFENRSEKVPFSVQARQFYNDIFIQIHWGNLLRKTVRNKVFLSSIHGVKGLQFYQVHICGLSCFEHIHSSICSKCGLGKNIQSIKDALDDSKKILYVGVSRAQKELFLYSTEISEKGKIRRMICLLSPYTTFLNILGNGQFCS